MGRRAGTKNMGGFTVLCLKSVVENGGQVLEGGEGRVDGNVGTTRSTLGLDILRGEKKPRAVGSRGGSMG